MIRRIRNFLQDRRRRIEEEARERAIWDGLIQDWKLRKALTKQLKAMAERDESSRPLS